MDTASRIRRFIPIQRLTPALQEKAVDLGEVHGFSDGQLIYQHGDPGEEVHYLLSGTVEFIWQDRVTRSLSASNKAALDQLDPPGRKRYSVRASGQATICRFNRTALARLGEQFEATERAQELEVSDIGSERSSDWMIRMLQSELFSMLPATNIQKIFARMQQVEYRAEEMVVEQGGAGEHYYVIETGYCEVSRTIATGRSQIH